MTDDLSASPRLTGLLFCVIAPLIAFACASPPSASISSRAPTTQMRFFVTSTGVDGSAALGGLAGADAHCQSLARAAGAGDKTWRAYLSTSARGDQPGVDARDRIGRGPWYNLRGDLIARDLGELHSDRNGITRHTALTERGAVPEKSHDILTGSDESGRLAYTAGVPATCSDWTVSADGFARIGHNDRMDTETFHNRRFKRWYGSWSSEHDTVGCGAAALARTGGSGLFYCFATDHFAAHPDEPGASGEATFERGINVNHWLGDNLDESLLKNAHYGAPWFDQEDVRWIASQGFDHVRIWVAGHTWIGENGDLDEAAVRHFDRALGWAKASGLGVVLAMHSTPGYRASIRGGPPPADQSSPFSDEATRGDAAYLWWLVARRYAREGEHLRFELIVQPDAPNAEAMQSFNHEVLAAVRRTSPERIVYLASHDQEIDTVGEVDLSDPRTGLSVRFWDPVSFTYQFDPRVPRITFPSKGISGALVDERVARLASRLRDLPERPVYVAEFGVSKNADDASARNYLGAARASFEGHGFAWAVYDYHTGFAARDGQGNATRVVEGLLTRSQ